MTDTLSTQRSRSLSPWFRRGPFAALQEMEDMVRRFWDEEGGAWGAGALTTPLDLAETDKEINLRLDLPGVDAKDIDIQVSGNRLTISGERKEEKEREGETYHRIERSAGRFSRSVDLPCAVQEDKVKAQFKDGVLTITMPKTAKSQSRRIEVQT